jgi:hypothetical protein
MTASPRCRVRVGRLSLQCAFRVQICQTQTRHPEEFNYLDQSGLEGFALAIIPSSFDAIAGNLSTTALMRNTFPGSRSTATAPSRADPSAALNPIACGWDASTAPPSREVIDEAVSPSKRYSSASRRTVRDVTFAEDPSRIHNGSGTLVMATCAPHISTKPPPATRTNRDVRVDNTLSS